MENNDFKRLHDKIWKVLEEEGMEVNDDDDLIKESEEYIRIKMKLKQPTQRTKLLDL